MHHDETQKKWVPKFLADMELPTASDICDAAPMVTSNALEVYPLGVTTVTFTAADASGNVSTAITTVTVWDTTPPVLSNVPDPVTVEQTSLDGTPVSLTPPTATDICDAAPDVTSDAPPVFPLGKTTVTFTAVDDSGNATSASTSVTVVDTTPPRIRSAKAKPSTLWPPNHKMVPVRIMLSVQDVCDAQPYCRIISVKSNEPVVGTGGGDRAPDWVVTGNLTLKLRAERSGKGNGRVYTIKVRCTDDSGNSSTKTVKVKVPHDRGGSKKKRKSDSKGGDNKDNGGKKPKKNSNESKKGNKKK
jgi:hypothetical protein